MELAWRDPDSHRGPLGYEPSVVLLHYPAVTRSWSNPGVPSLTHPPHQLLESL